MFRILGLWFSIAFAATPLEVASDARFDTWRSRFVAIGWPADSLLSDAETWPGVRKHQLLPLESFPLIKLEGIRYADGTSTDSVAPVTITDLVVLGQLPALGFRSYLAWCIVKFDDESMLHHGRLVMKQSRQRGPKSFAVNHAVASLLNQLPNGPGQIERPFRRALYLWQVADILIQVLRGSPGPWRGLHWVALDAAIRLRGQIIAHYPAGFGGDHNADVTQLSLKSTELSSVIETALLRALTPDLTVESICARRLE